MAYDDSRFRGEPGFRDEPDFRVGGVPEDAPSVTGVTSASRDSGVGNRRSAPTPAQLDEVFDDPEHGDPGRDRMAVHALWELVLLLAAGALVYLLRDADGAALRGAGLKQLMLLAAEIGFV